MRVPNVICGAEPAIQCDFAPDGLLRKPPSVLYTETKTVYIDYSGHLQKAQIDTAKD